MLNVSATSLFHKYLFQSIYDLVHFRQRYIVDLLFAIFRHIPSLLSFEKHGIVLLSSLMTQSRMVVRSLFA